MVTGPTKAGCRLSVPSSEIALYLRTGEHDILFKAWPGIHVLDCCQRGTADLRRGLVREVRVRTKRVAMAVPEALAELDCDGFARKKVAPNGPGTVPDRRAADAARHARPLAHLPHPRHDRGRAEEDPGTAWDRANMYLLSCGAKLLADDAPRAVGTSVGTTCFVSMDHVRANHRFADFVVHEAAHIFHNCKRRTLGLPQTGRREWLLEIDFKKREGFAYACEAYSRILELADGPQARGKLYQELESGPQLGNALACAQDYLEAVCAAIAACHGWKRILHACALPWTMRTRSQDQPA